MGSHRFPRGCGRECRLDGRNSRGPDRHAVLLVGGVLLGDQDGSIHSSILLRGPVSGDLEVAGHAADALASPGHFASLKGGKDLGHTAAAAGVGPAPEVPALWADSTLLLGPERFKCSGRGGLALDLRATTMKSPGVTAPGWCLPFLRGAVARLFSWPILLVENGAEVGDVSAVTPDKPPLPLPLVLVAQSLELRFNLSMMVHILAVLHALGGGIPLGPGVAVLPVPFKLSHEATDDGQAGFPSLVLGAGHGTWMWLWVCLLMQKLQAVVDVRVLVLLMRMLRTLLDVRVLLGTLRWT